MHAWLRVCPFPTRKGLCGSGKRDAIVRRDGPRVGSAARQAQPRPASRQRGDPDQYRGDCGVCDCVHDVKRSASTTRWPEGGAPGRLAECMVRQVQHVMRLIVHLEDQTKCWASLPVKLIHATLSGLPRATALARREKISRLIPVKSFKLSEDI